MVNLLSSLRVAVWDEPLQLAFAAFLVEKLCKIYGAWTKSGILSGKF